MEIRPESRLVVIRPADGEAVSLGKGFGTQFKISGNVTGGGLSIVEHPVKAGTLIPPHVHHGEDELSYVLSGEFGVRVGDEVVTVEAGSYVWKPRGIPHTFWNAGPGDGRIMELIMPAGFEQFFAEAAKGGRDPDRAKRYDVEFLREWIPELEAKYNLTLLGNDRPAP